MCQLMDKVERFDKDALSKRVNDYFQIVVNDCNEIKDIRFLILRFCIACEKVIDDFLSKYNDKNSSEADGVLDLQLSLFKLKRQSSKLKLNNLNNSFVAKVALMKSICQFKNEDNKFLEFLDFLRNARNIVGHQLITLDEVYSYLIQEKGKFVYSFVEEKAKPMLDKWLSMNNFHEILKFLLPVISIEINELQVRILNH